MLVTIGPVFRRVPLQRSCRRNVVFQPVRYTQIDKLGPQSDSSTADFPLDNNAAWVHVPVRLAQTVQELQRLQYVVDQLEGGVRSVLPLTSEVRKASVAREFHHKVRHALAIAVSMHAPYEIEVPNCQQLLHVGFE